MHIVPFLSWIYSFRWPVLQVSLVIIKLIFSGDRCYLYLPRVFSRGRGARCGPAHPGPVVGLFWGCGCYSALCYIDLSSKIMIKYNNASAKAVFIFIHQFGRRDRWDRRKRQGWRTVCEGRDRKRGGRFIDKRADRQMAKIHREGHTEKYRG